MRWTPGGPSGDVVDRRGAGGGGFGGFGGGAGKLGCGGFVVVLLLSVVFGQDFFSLLGGAGGQAPIPQGQEVPPTSSTPEEEQLVKFVEFVVGDVQNTWTEIFSKSGQTYPRAQLVLFRNGTRSGCGVAQSAMGPFYCPADQSAYIDLAFYDQLSGRFGAPGDFAQAYVIAHEFGHHVQNVLGISDEVRSAQQSNPRNANQLSVLLELQADCFAGVWGHSAAQRNHLEPGDIEEGLGAAAAVGDDNIQQQSGGFVNQESWTHGSAQQRSQWFRRGFESGDMDSCNTFEAVR
jgi:predicted metalloprotease